MEYKTEKKLRHGNAMCALYKQINIPVLEIDNLVCFVHHLMENFLRSIKTHLKYF